jgi:hypothetical protein
MPRSYRLDSNSKITTTTGEEGGRVAAVGRQTPDNIHRSESGGGGGKKLPLADDIVVAAGIENGCLDWKYGPVFIKTLQVVLFLSAMMSDEGYYR